MHRLHRARALLAVGPLAIAAALSGPSIALADCAMPPPMGEAAQTAEIVFVGTVVATTNQNRWANVQVEEVWRGPDQPAAVVVRGGGADPNMMSSVDRAFETGVKYVFFPYADAQGGLADNSCTSTTQWSAEMLALRPADPRAPIAAEASEEGFAGLLVPLAAALVLGLGLVGIGLLARGRQSA